MITYTTLQVGGVEKSLADWKIGTWSRNVSNQANDDFTCTIQTPMDGTDIFPYGTNIIVRTNRIASRASPLNSTAPASLNDGGGALSFSGGTQWFWGYCIDLDRLGDPGSETFNYKFVGPFQFFFERLIFQKLQLTWNGTKQIADYQSDVILGLSLTPLSGTGDTVQGTTATDVMSIPQQVKEICMFAQADSAFQQSTNGLGWVATGSIDGLTNPQFLCDQLTTTVDGINYDLLQTPSTNVLIQDYAASAVSGHTSASTLPAGSFILRAPLDAANAITCKDALSRCLKWFGGIGSPVIWTDHSTTPPTLRVATKDLLPVKSLPLTGITVKTKIKKRTDLIPGAVHFKYKVSGTFLSQPYSVVLNDVAGFISGGIVEGTGQLGGLSTIAGGGISTGNQAALMAQARSADSIVGTFDFQGTTVNAASCKISTQTLNLVDPSGTGADGGFWANLFPELANVDQSTLKFYNSGSPGVTITDAANPATVYYSGGSWTGTNYVNQVVDGQVAPWMLASTSSPTNPVGGKTVKAKITVRFAYKQKAQGASTNYATTETVGYHEKNIVVTLTTLTTGTYYSSPQTSYGEPLPYGLAGYILALESIPQYEGSIAVQEQEITDICPIGNVLNITGGLAEWKTMKACIQAVRYSDNGQTEITFGPAKHLSPAQFKDRFKRNMGPREYLMIATDPMNQSNPGSAQLGNNIPALNSTDGGKVSTFLSLLTDISAQQGGGGNVATLPAGIHFDTGLAANPFTGTIASGQLGFRAGQGITLGQGPISSNPGETMAWIRLHMGDLQNATGTLQNMHVYLREIRDCETISGTPTPGFRLVLSSEFYTTSIRATPDP